MLTRSFVKAMAGLGLLTVVIFASGAESPALKDEDPEIRWQAIDTLGDLGPVAKEAIRALSPLVKDSNPFMRQHAAAAFLECLDDGVAVPWLVVEHSEQERVEVPAECIGLHV